MPSCGFLKMRASACSIGGDSMMAAFILVCSVILLLQFFVSYCRSLIAASVREQISQEVQEVTGMTRPATEEESRELCSFCSSAGTPRGTRGNQPNPHLLPHARCDSLHDSSRGTVA